MSQGLKAATIAAAAFAAAATALGAITPLRPSDSRSSEEGRHIRASIVDANRRWRSLPALPSVAPIDFDGASIAVAGHHLYVAVIGRAKLDTDPSQVTVYRLEGARWAGPIGGQPLLVNRGAQVVLTGGQRPCITAPRGQWVLVFCAASDRWEQLGPPVFSTTFPEPITGFDGAFLSRGKLIVARAHLRNATSTPGGVAVEGRLEHHLFSYYGGRWRDLGGELDSRAPGGSQRPFGVEYKRQACVAYDRIARGRRTGPIIVVRCLKAGKWRDVGIPYLRNRGSYSRSAINVDGVASAGRHLYVGMDMFERRSVRWRVLDFDGTSWAALPPTSEDRTWNDQGTIYEFDGRVYVVVFGQRQGPSGLRTRLRVLALDGKRRWRQLGAPLLRNAAFNGPLYWGLVDVGSDIYAMATVPASDHARNEVRVSRLASIHR